jgi:hypothetical protein
MNWRTKLLGGLAAFLLLGVILSSSTTVHSADSAAACCSTHQASETQAAADLQKTLDPKQFTGQIREVYKIARENPDLLAQLHCYCGCDRTNGHKNLLDCYRSTHAASCAICNGEVLEAKKLFDQGASIETIRAALRNRFAGAMSN